MAISLIFFMGSTVVPPVVMTSQLDLSYLNVIERARWFYALPYSWFAGLVHLALGNTEPHYLFLSAMAMVSTILLVIIPLWRISLKYSERISYMGESPGASRKIKPIRGSILARLFRDSETLVAFDLVSKYLKRDRNTKTRIYAGLALPLLLIVTWRGEPGLKDEPQHELMGQITFDLLKSVRVKCDDFPTSDDEIEDKIADAINHMNQTGLPYAFIMRKDTVDKYELQTHRNVPFIKSDFRSLGDFGSLCCCMLERREAIAIVADLVQETGLIISTTGKISRELFYHEDRTNQLYVVGSMGCASSIALGVALYRPEKKLNLCTHECGRFRKLKAKS